MQILFSSLMAVLSVTVSQINSDEVVVLYPGYAQLEKDGRYWSLAVHGKVYEPEGSSWRRSAMVGALRRTLQVKKGTPEYERFQQRVRLFTVDNERGKEIAVRIGPNVYPAGTSASNGHFRATIRLPATSVAGLPGGGPAEDRWIDLEAVTKRGDRRRFTGRVQLVAATGLSIISDIDDTIKHTDVRRRKAMLANTFLNEFRPVPDMAAIYGQAARAGVAFHYVSGSPWQLYGPLREFLREEGFPAGSFHLKHFRLKDSSAAGVLGSQEDYKAGHIEPILAAFPKRRFILIGDSGEQDPEIYGGIARKHPKQIVAVWIRNVTGEKADGRRMGRAFEGIDRNRWRLFDAAKELGTSMKRLTETALGGTDDFPNQPFQIAKSTPENHRCHPTPPLTRRPSAPWPWVST